MHWWDFETDSLANSLLKNTYRHALGEPQHNIFLPIFEKIVILIDNSLVECDAMMHVLKDFINVKYSELLTKEISKSN